MNATKNLNILIASKIVEIIFVCAFILISIPLCQRIGKSAAQIDFSDKNLNFTSLAIENNFGYSMYPMSQTDALNKLVPTKLIVANNSLTTESYDLILKVSKNSTLDYNCLNIAIDDKIVPLNSLKYMEDSINNYFIIASESLKGDNKEYRVKIWIDEKTGNEMQNKELNLSFEIEKNVIKI